MADGLEACRSKTRRDTNHVRFGNTAVDHAIRAGLRGLRDADAAHQVRVEVHAIGIVVDHLGNHFGKYVLERLDVGRAVVNYLHASTPSFFSASRSA